MRRQEDNRQSNWTKIEKQVKLEDLYHMMYLKPFECILDQNPGGLPKGLKIVQRHSQTQYSIKQIVPLLSYQEFHSTSKPPLTQQKKQFPSYLSYLQANRGDNLLCQMKIQGQIQMAICICMYNEDRSMLQNTLLGVGENIVRLYKQGVDTDKIIVIIVQDGIQKMDHTILSLFQILQNQSGMRFSSENQQKLQDKIKQLDQKEQNRSTYGWQGQNNYVDMNGFLFTSQQLEKRKSLRYVQVKREYNQYLKLAKQIQELDKRRTLTYQDLPGKILEFYKLQCKAKITGQAFSSNGGKKMEEFQQLDKYMIKDINESQPLIRSAIVKAKQLCKLYIQSRSQMSHVSFFRTSQFFPDSSEFGTKKMDDLNIKRSKLKPVRSHKLIPLTQEDKQFQSIENKFAIKMNIFFVVKYRNNQKLSSHNWFFNGFCKQFSNAQVAKEENGLRKVKMGETSPKYTILLDVGLRPQGKALCKMYNTMVNHQEIGGVCGYMGLKIQRADPSQEANRQSLDFVSSIFLNFVDIQRAQQLEYHFAHLIDKGFQSIFKFIHVLPGAFSGYNMKAIWGQNPDNSDKLLSDYFASIGEKVKSKSFKNVELNFCKILCRVIFPNFIVRKFIEPIDKHAKDYKESYEQLMYSSNVYLAEDRILCMGIHKNQKDLMFLPDAYSFVDPVKDIGQLLGQRKRWINGSFFAFQKVSQQFSEMGMCQPLGIQIYYLAFMNLLAYIAPGFFLFTISVAMEAFKADILVKVLQGTLPMDSPIYDAFVFTINFIYALMILGLVFFSVNLTNREKQFMRFVYSVSTFLGIMSLIIMVILVTDLIRGLGESDSYLIANQNSEFITSIPGGQNTIDILRYVLLGMLSLYVLPIIIYCALFRNIRPLLQIIAGSISFVFYQPTYLIILNIYALCRMDDLSWGTKGLDAGDTKDDAVKTIWKIVKTIHVGKFLFWNIIVAGLLIHFGNDYLIRFWLTFGLMGLIVFTMLVKVGCALFYFLYYKCCISQDNSWCCIKAQDDSKNNNARPSLLKDMKKSVSKSTLQTELITQVKKNLETLQTQAKRQNGSQSQMDLFALNIFVSMRPVKDFKKLDAQSSKIYKNLLSSRIEKNQRDIQENMRRKGKGVFLSPIKNNSQKYIQDSQSQQKIHFEEKPKKKAPLLAGKKLNI